jgi:SOS regulatory protein LexA
MIFDKKKFAEQLEMAKGNRSINEYARECGISAAHISRLLRQMIDTPPSPETIEKLAEKAYNGITYYQLMQSAGYITYPKLSAQTIKKIESMLDDPNISKETKKNLIDIRILDVKNEAEISGLNEIIYYNNQVREVPIIGYVPAGKPVLSEETIIDYLPLPCKILNNMNDDIFCLQIHGDSMIDIGINDNDIILVQAQPTAENGQTVIARLNDGEVTCKRFYKLNGTCRLEPANKNYAPIDCKDVEIIGVVKKVIKDIY